MRDRSLVHGPGGRVPGPVRGWIRYRGLRQPCDRPFTVAGMQMDPSQDAPLPRRRRRWLVAGVALLALAVVGVHALTADSDPATVNATQYGPPPDPCTLLDESPLRSWAPGTPKAAGPEESHFPDEAGGDVDGQPRPA